MKIAFDLRWIRGEKIDGISRYAGNLVSHLLQFDSENEYLLIGDKTILQQHLDLSSFSSANIVSINQQLLSPQDFLFTQRDIQRLGIDILHIPNYLSSPFGGNYKKILTVYDLIPFLFPDALSKSRALWRWFYKTIYPARVILRSADKIITTSENTKRDIVRLLHIAPERIQVVWIGIENRFKPDYEVPEEFWQKYRLPQRFLLYVGRQDPYKGLKYLVQAYALLPESLQQKYHIVIAGKTDSRYIGEVHKTIDKLQLQTYIHFLDYVPDEDLPLLYTAATILTHPSLYEGFGLPPLEAMACGTPVVYADTSSLSELIGEAGVAVTPSSPESLADGIQQFLQNEQLRLSFSQKGLHHVQRYSWQHIARDILKIYEQFM